LSGGGDVLTRAVIALDQINKLLSEKNVREVGGTLQDLHAVMTELRKQDIVISDLDGAVKSIGDTSTKIGALSEDSRKLVIGDGARLVANLSVAAEELRRATADTRVLIAELKEPSTRFAEGGLPEVTRAAASLQQASESLDRLVRSIEASPMNQVNKAPARTVEIKP
jgi:phospholipid/cholesterol/gamma-HCH transport system substrate-binding protein